MIPVRPAAEPVEFDAVVRQPGLDALRELTGQPRLHPRSGPKRRRIYARVEDIPSDELPERWTDALNWLVTAYSHTCAYAALRIPAMTGQPTVEHFEPKSKRPDLAYEWNNYRLVCQLLNARKCDFCDVLDPFAIEDGWFALDLVSGACIVGPDAHGDTRARVKDTIDRLGLDGAAYKSAITERLDEWREELSTFEHVRKWAPFLARELVRQGKCDESGRRVRSRILRRSP